MVKSTNKVQEGTNTAPPTDGKQVKMYVPEIFLK